LAKESGRDWPKNNRVQEYFSVKFRKLLSGAPDGVPPWLQIIADGDTGGLFVPTDAPWIVHRDFGTLVGGIRALLMQALHPGSLAGVAQHSRYETDALGRLSGTIRWLTVTTFGSHAAVASEAARVNRLHERVSGNYEAGGNSVAYRAADKDLLLWVHLAFTDSFLAAHNRYTVNPVDEDAYVEQWGRSVAQLGLNDVPRTYAQLQAQLAGFDAVIRCDETTKSVIGFIKNVKLPWYARPIYRVLWLAAVASLKPKYREMLGLAEPPSWVTPFTRWMLRAIRTTIGPESPIEDGALRRLERLG
jgi:uncharacterized protein (DUF2236 family)